MKIKNMLVVAAVSLTGLLYAESVSIPVLWKSKTFTEAKTGELQAFGFYENQDTVVLAFQVKDLPALIAKPKSYMSFYADADDNLETGRYKNNLGWDFQINMILTRKGVLSMIKYTDDKSAPKELSRVGSTVSSNGDMLYVTMPKKALSGIAFKPQFKFRTLQLRDNQRVDQKNNSGFFPDKFDVPANK